MTLRKEMKKDMQRENTQNKEMKEKMKKRKGKKHDKQGNKWRGVTILLRTGGQGHPTPIHTPSPTHIHKKHLKRSFPHFSTRGHGPTDQRTDRRTKPLIELRVRN